MVVQLDGISIVLAVLWLVVPTFVKLEHFKNAIVLIFVILSGNPVIVVILLEFLKQADGNSFSTSFQPSAKAIVVVLSYVSDLIPANVPGASFVNVVLSIKAGTLISPLIVAVDITGPNMPFSVL